MSANTLNGLYPIIRRVRRPLLPVEAPADAKPEVPPVQKPKAGAEQQSEQPEPETKDGKATATEPAK